jgi:phenylacetate-CoA ligase
LSDFTNRDHDIAQLLEFAARHSPYYRDQDWAARVRSGKKVHLTEIPKTSKSEVKKNTAGFYSDFVPEGQGRVIEKFTSGTSGVPLRILKTALHFSINSEENGRLQSGWGQESHLKIVGTSYPDGEHVDGLLETRTRKNGVTERHIYSFASRKIADLLVEFRPSHFTSRPSVVHGVLLEGRDLSFLELITTVSEIVSPGLLYELAKLPNCKHYDSYGTVETGILAAQCAVCGEYHAADLHASIEIIGEDGRSTNAGEMGRVVVTPIYNLAMPLLRYDLEDFVVVSKKQDCNKSTQSFSRIVGRERNLFKLPGGGVVTPNIPPEILIELGILQYKLVQTKLDEIEFYYVPKSLEVVLSQVQAQNIISANISSTVRALPISVDEMPRSPNGKFLMHESLI